LWFGRRVRADAVSETFNTNGSGRTRPQSEGLYVLVAGAGVKGWHSYGETDELGEGAVVNRHHLRDLHATILHLMGLEHQS
jgi:hypothetical protein